MGAHVGRPDRALARAVATLAAGAFALGACSMIPVPTSGGAVGFTAPPAGFEVGSPVITAVNVAFDRVDLSVPVAVAFTLVLRNQDNLDHNISIFRDAEFKDRVMEGKLFAGPATLGYPVPALAPGTYFFRCDIHPIPAMTGRLQAP